MTQSILMKDSFEWLNEFRAKYGRYPRVLHIGNIANNAYNNAKLLNQVGLDCDVICYSYYHIMGCPEWEDADFEGEIRDQFFPDWNSVNLNGFRRPRWFAQGSVKLCIKYLSTRRQGKKLQSWFWWKTLEAESFLKCSPVGIVLIKVLKKLYRYIKLVVLKLKFLGSYLMNIRRKWFPLGQVIFYFFATLVTPLLFIFYLFLCPVIITVKIIKILPWFQTHEFIDNYCFDSRTDKLLEEFEKNFPSRTDQLTKEDLEMYRNIIPHWRKLFNHYDIIQAYATDPIIPLLAAKQPYIAFEHGTLRTFTLRNNQVCRNTSLAYNQASHVFITNGDCLEYAQKIGVTKFSPMLHPFDEKRIRAVECEYDKLHKKLNIKYIFLCTLRHDWNVKGTDIYIRALPKIQKKIGNDFRLIMTNWGSQVLESKALASELGVSNLIEWIEPLNRHKLLRMLKSVDMLFDQIMLPHFGATAPEGIAAGVPVIMSYEPASTAWIVNEPAPILSAWTVEEIVKNVQKGIDPIWLKEYQFQAQKWIEKCHSSAIVVKKHLDAYHAVL